MRSVCVQWWKEVWTFVSKRLRMCSSVLLFLTSQLSYPLLPVFSSIPPTRDLIYSLPNNPSPPPKPSTHCLPSLSSPLSWHFLLSCLSSSVHLYPPPPPELTFWFYVKEHLNRHELQRFYSLRQISSELGRGRAWLRCALNEHSLERYLHTLLADRPRLGWVNCVCVVYSFTTVQWTQ